MRFDEFQQLGFEITEREMLSYERQIIANYQEAYKSVKARLEAMYLTKLSDVAPIDYYNEMLKRNRLDTMLKQIAADYATYAKASGKATIKALETGFTDNYYRQQYTTAWSEAVKKFTVLPESLIELSTVGTDKSFKAVSDAVVKKFGEKASYMPQVGSLSDLLSEGASKEVEAIRREIISGLRNGQGFKKTASSIKEIIGYRFTEAGQSKMKGAMASAVRIVRTEGTRVLNSASFANMNQLDNQGVDVYKMWLATLDDRTRDRHQSLDGQKRDVDKPFDMGGDSAMYPGDFSSVGMNVNCRCTVNTIVPGLEPDIRIGRNPVTGKNEVFAYKDYSQWRKENG